MNTYHEGKRRRDSSPDFPEDKENKMPQIYASEDKYQSEIVYSDLLQRLMVFVNHLRGF